MNAMKKILLTAALLLAALPLLRGQDTPTLNKKNLIIKEWNTDAKSNQRVLDHLTTYNPDGATAARSGASATNTEPTAK